VLTTGFRNNRFILCCFAGCRHPAFLSRCLPRQIAYRDIDSFYAFTYSCACDDLQEVSTMTYENPEEAMTFGELLTLIGDQQRRLTVLETAFSWLPFCLDERASQLLSHSMRLESQNQENDAALQTHYARLAEALEKRTGSSKSEPVIE
jgi:hypothetical protein